MGIELMPWQKTVLQEALKVKPGGDFVYRRVGIMVARQQGKSALLRCLIAGSMLLQGRSWIAMAQNRKLARDQLEFAAKSVRRLPWITPEQIEFRQANGQELLALTNEDGERATWQIAAASSEGPRGMTGNLWVDELREISPAAWTAATPVTRAVPNSQIWVTSNAGDMHSEVLNDFRQRALTNTDPSVLWMEWSADPALNLNLTSEWEQAVLQSNPAIGHTVDIESIRTAFATDKPEAFTTEVLCRWVDTLDSPWPPESWQRCEDPQLSVGPGPATWLAIDVTPDRRRADLVAGQQLDDGRIAVGLVQSWTSDSAVDELTIAGDVAKWARTYSARVVAFDRWAAAAIASRLASVGIPVGDVSGANFAQACDETLAAMNSGRIRHAGQPELTAHIMSCARKPASDGGWRIIRRGSNAPISAAVALVMVVHHANQPQKVADIIVA